MPNRALLRLAAHDGVRRLVTGSPAARPVVRRFVAGETLDSGLAAARDLNARGIGAILDYLGENVSSPEQADAALGAYLESLQALRSPTGEAPAPDAHVSVKLTQLGLDQSLEAAVERMRRICSQAEARAGTRVAIDMEAHPYTDRTIAAYRILRPGTDRLVLCLQATLRRTEADVAALGPASSCIRLCKGAYDEPGDLAYGPQETTSAYLRLLHALLPAAPYTAVATHDEHCIEEAIRLAEEHRLPRDRFEFQMLYGVRRELQAALVARGYRVRVYVPFGAQWYPYLMRRLAERPANLRLFLASLLRG